MRGDSVANDDLLSEERFAEAAQAQSREPRLSDNLKSLAAEVSGLLQAGRELLLSETRLFLSSLLLIVLLALVISFLIGPVWIFLGAALAFFLMQQFAIAPAAALLLTAAIFLIAVILLGVWIYRLTFNLKFRHTRQAVKSFVSSAGSGETEEAAP